MRPSILFLLTALTIPLPAGATTSVDVRSSRPVTLSLDGELVGTAPLCLTSLTAGLHVLRATPEGHEAPQHYRLLSPFSFQLATIVDLDGVAASLAPVPEYRRFVVPPEGHADGDMACGGEPSAAVPVVHARPERPVALEAAVVLLDEGPPPPVSVVYAPPPEPSTVIVYEEAAAPLVEVDPVVQVSGGARRPRSRPRRPRVAPVVPVVVTPPPPPPPRAPAVRRVVVSRPAGRRKARQTRPAAKPARKPAVRREARVSRPAAKPTRKPAVRREARVSRPTTPSPRPTPPPARAARPRREERAARPAPAARSPSRPERRERPERAGKNGRDPRKGRGR